MLWLKSLRVFAVPLLILLVAAAGRAQANLKKWEAFDFGKQKVLLKDLQPLELEDLLRLRGVVFGKHGRIFKEQTIQQYLEKRPWYKPDPNFTNAALNQVERRNIDTIRQAEAEKHDAVMPGDLRFWQTKLIPEDKIFAQTSAEWRVMIAEIEAIKGKTFPDEPWLQKYFEERYWYKPNPNYSPSVLTKIERENLEAITKKRDAERRVAISPGDMDKFQNAILDAKLLEGATLNDLRVMRNEFWARRGKKFETPGYRQFFVWQEWYRPAKDQSKIELNEIEKRNVATIQAYENQVREKLANEPLTEEMLSGLFTEDLRLLRNEIYARRGRIYKTKDLNDYFSEQPWYKPDPNYNDNLLSKIERDNLKIIKDAEISAVSKLIEVEG